MQDNVFSNSPVHPYFPALTGIRAIAAWMVFSFHYNPFPANGNNKIWLQIAHRIVNELHIGVSIFFVLSGFLICYCYYGIIANRPGKWLFRYFINRLARIYPLYLFVTSYTFLSFFLNPMRYEQTYDGLRHALMKEQLGILLLNITLLKGLFNQYKFSGIAQSWSLTVEECFYIGAPWFMMILKRRRLAWIILPVGSFLMLSLLWLIIGRLNWHGLFSGIMFNLNYTFFGRCIEFFLGMMLAVKIIGQQYKLKIVSSGYYTGIGISLLFICLLLMSFISGDDNSKEKFSGVITNNLFIPIAICFIIYGLITENTQLKAILSARIMDLLGKSSYAFYLIHLGVLSIYLRTYLSSNPVIIFLVMNLVAVLLYKIIELPCYLLIKRTVIQ